MIAAHIHLDIGEAVGRLQHLGTGFEGGGEHAPVDLDAAGFQVEAAFERALGERQAFQRLHALDIDDQAVIGGDAAAVAILGHFGGEVVAHQQIAEASGDIGGDAAGGVEITAECNPTGNNPSVPYTSAVEQTNGTWQITWDSSTAPALGTINPNSNLTISFPTKTREYFQQNYVNSTPVLSNDTGRNDVDIAGAAWVICAPGAPSPCPNLSPDKIDTDFTDGTVLDDDSDATQVGSGPSINKQVSPTVNGNCGSLNDYASGITPVASPGDTICWRLTMSFPNNLTTSNVAFGGRNLDQLFITGGLEQGETSEGGIFRLSLGVKGLAILPPKAG